MKLSRQSITEMSDAELDERRAEILRWIAAGATDGAEAKPVKRDDGHKFTRAEITGMSDDEFEANVDAIARAVRAGKVR